MTDSSPPARPLVPVFLAMMAGILFDRWAPMPLFVWLLTAAIAAGSWRLARKHDGASIFLWLAIGAAAGAWHHRQLWNFASDDIGNFVRESKLCRVRGVVVSEPKHADPADNLREDDAALSGWRSEDGLTTFVIGTSQLHDAAGWNTVGGQLWVRVRGAGEAVRRGDEVEILGWLQRPEGPGNPGEFDFAAYLRDQRVRATLFAEEPAALKILAPDVQWSMAGYFDLLRSTAADRLDHRLTPSQAKLAKAVLLGDQNSMTTEETEPFFRSGTIHLLVVSGQHLGILFGILWAAGGLSGLGLQTRALLIMAALIAYSLFTGGNPPVVRAAVLSVAFLGSYVVSRPAQPLNSLAGAGIVVLILDPTQLFRGGTQLSFLAVLAILLFVLPSRQVARWFANPTTGFLPPLRRWLRRAGLFLLHLTLASLVIWTVVSPLILYRFHIISPLSVLLSVLLIFPITVALLAGMLFLMVDPLSSTLSALLAWLLGKMLDFTSWSVEISEECPGAYCYAPSLPGWWVLGFYLLLLSPYCRAKFHPTLSYAGAHLIWAAIGGAAIVGGHWLPRPFAYQQLAVGHGACSVLRFPEGTNVLYDCGSMRGPDIAERAVAPALWDAGIGVIGAAFLSHADIDHFNGVIRLADLIPIRSVWITPQFAQSREPAALYLERELRRRGIPIRLTWAGDQFRMGVRTLDVVQPTATFGAKSDNDGSLVLECRSPRTKILLTGDLHGDGILELLSLPPRDVDILLIPHHGSTASNPPQLASWLRPKLAICSAERRGKPGNPLAPYEQYDAVGFRTDRDGAVLCTETATGFRAASYRSRRTAIFPAAPR